MSAPPATVPPLTITGRDPSRAVTFPRAMLLAPMDGITDRLFREMLLGLGDAGGACTEFLRISIAALPRKVFRREIPPVPEPGSAPVGVQLMASDAEFVAETVANAEAAGARWIDLNFGCPVKRVFNKCAGSALLAHPERLGSIVAAAVGATTLPVTAKIRAGVDDDGPLHDVLDACAEAGAAAVTLHARLRRHSYAEPATWDWIARAAARLHGRSLPLPLIGNGGVTRGEHVAAMLRETGCDAVMIGRAAFADPWIFREALGGPAATREEAVAFARLYLDALCPPGGPTGGICQFKRLVAVYRAGGLFDGREGDRGVLLRAHDPAIHRAWLDASLPVAA